MATAFKPYPPMRLSLSPLFPALLLSSTLAHGLVIGTEDFSYPDGGIDGRNGGTGWNRVGGTSSWFGPANVLGGALTTDNNAGGFRTYGADEAASAVQASGQVFYRLTLSFGDTVPNYAGISSFDFGTERIFFGRAFLNQLAIDESGVGVTLTGIAAQANTTYTLIGVIDFDNDLLSLFVNPTGADVYDPSNPSGVGNTAQAIRTGFTSTNWSTRIRLQAGDVAGAPATWDNVTVATAPQDVGLAIPEPSAAAVLAAGLLCFSRRRRTHA
jgi:hypothetical protein